jgi:hypothetical protein
MQRLSYIRQNESERNMEGESQLTSQILSWLGAMGNVGSINWTWNILMYRIMDGFKFIISLPLRYFCSNLICLGCPWIGIGTWLGQPHKRTIALWSDTYQHKVYDDRKPAQWIVISVRVKSPKPERSSIGTIISWTPEMCNSQFSECLETSFRIRVRSGLEDFTLPFWI